MALPGISAFPARCAERPLQCCFALSLLCSIGCISYREGLPEENRKWPPARPEGGRKSSIRLLIASTYPKELWADPWPGNQLGERASRRIESDTKRGRGTRALFEASGLFDGVFVDPHPATLLAELEFVHGPLSTSTALGVLWFCLFGCTPIWWQEELTLKATFKDAGGRVIGTTERYVRVVTWMWIPGSCLAGWAPPTVDPDFTDTMRDLLQTTILDAYEKGYVTRTN